MAIETTALTVNQARRLVLASQGLHRQGDFGKGLNAVTAVAQRLSYVQIDTISVVQRAHHHTLWNRARSYQPDLLDAAVEQRQLFEYWSHAAAYLPMADYRFSLPRKHAIASGQRHWYDKDPHQAKFVLDRVRAEGPLQASDFKQARSIKRTGWGDLKPSKLALEQLFMEGELMIRRRNGFQKVFDLAERVIPDGIDTSTPTAVDYYDHLIFRYLNANGLGTPAEIAYLRKGLKPLIARRCLDLAENGELQIVIVGRAEYFVRSAALARLRQKQSRTAVKILSPFDNLVIQRSRMRDLFDFDYQIECYVPPAKRKYGYFALPILAGQDFIGRVDAKVDRKAGLLTLNNVALQIENFDDYQPALTSALHAFMSFNGASSLRVSHASLNGKAVPARQFEKQITRDLP